MKTINFRNFRIIWSLRFYRVKRVTWFLPDNADNVHYSGEEKCIIYRIGSRKKTIKLPDHQTGQTIHITPMYKKKAALQENRLMQNNTDRLIIVELMI